MPPTRRDLAVLAAGALAAAAPAPAATRKFTSAFTPGSIGVKADQRQAIDMAARHGFEAVQPFGDDLATLSGSQLNELKSELKSKGLQWASAGMPVDFRGDEATFRAGLKALPEQAKVYERAGVTRISTWLRPMHDELTYLEYFRIVSGRLRETAAIVGDHGMRFGLEYVGTPSLRITQRFQFVHTMAETKELIAAAGRPNLGFVLDSWHWWTAGESAADIRTLSNTDVVSADLNDAPSGLTMLEQKDNTRELPAATGVIPIAEFLRALVEIGYDGPIRPEPFNKPLNDLEDEAASAQASTAMKKAFALA